MSTCYYGICLDCRQYIDLGKFYSWAAYAKGGYADLDKEDLNAYKRDTWVYRSLRLHYFMYNHQGHRVGVYNEHEFDGWYEDEWTEVYPWPRSGEEDTDDIDFTDPKAGRLIIHTQVGDIYLDVLQEGVNCFRFVNGERVDTLLLPAKK